MQIVNREQDKQGCNVSDKVKIYKCILCDKKGNTGMIRVLAKNATEIEQKVDSDCFIVELKLMGVQDLDFKGLLTVDVNDCPQGLKLSKVRTEDRRGYPAQDPDSAPF